MCFEMAAFERVLKTTASLDQMHNEWRLLNFGYMLNMMLNKFEKYEMPLSQDSLSK